MNTLRTTATQQMTLHRHLFPGDGKEAVVVALAGVAPGAGESAWALHELHPIPHADCQRTASAVTWPTAALKPLMAKAAADGFAIVRMHSHPSGQTFFSPTDDASDAELFEAIDRRVPRPHLSVVMLPSGAMFGRVLVEGAVAADIDRIAVTGDDIVFHDRQLSKPIGPRDFDVRHRQAFGDGTTELLGRLRVGVAGASGTGSPLIEMAARLGFGAMTIIDPDEVEPKNLNRIYGATRSDADAGINKAELARVRIEAMGLGTKVTAIPAPVESAQALNALKQCDIIFGCVDSVEGRDTLNRLSTFYSIPYLDLGVRLDADGEGGLTSISSSVHYLQPGGSSLRTRGVYDEAQLYAEYLKRTDPAFYQDQVERGYVRGVAVDRPAVISVNTATAAAAINEMLARLHVFRTRPNSEFAINKLLFTHGRTAARPDGEPDASLSPFVGRGDCIPPLMAGRLG